MQIPGDLASAASVVGLVYLAVAVFAVLRFGRAQPAPRAAQPAVTVLKPVCGADPELYDNLLSFCRQDYGGSVQMVVGVQRAADPAVAIVRRLIAEHPECDIALVIDGSLPGSNFKVCNLANMLTMAKHEILAIADSDMRVEPHYLATVTAPLFEPGIGAVTCIYKGRPVGAGGLARLSSSLACGFINYGFSPSVLVGRLLGAEAGCFGSTIVLRRRTLDAVGGFGAFMNQLADDYALGALIRAQGLEVALAPYVVENVVTEPDPVTLMRHELRWLRTIRMITPLGLGASVVTNPVGLALLALLLRDFAGGAWLLLALCLAARAALVYSCNRVFRVEPMPLALLPVRDALSLGLLGAAFCGQRVTWREHRFQIQDRGEMTLEGDPLV